MADALLIEMYATQLKKADPNDVYCFVTSNHGDFSTPNGDQRQPHPDLVDIFSSPQSRYLYLVDGLHAGLLDYFGDEFAEKYAEVEFLIGEEEPRTFGRDRGCDGGVLIGSGMSKISSMPLRKIGKYQRISLRCTSGSSANGLIQTQDGSLTLGTPKSRAGRRTVAIPDVIVPDLVWHLAFKLIEAAQDRWPAVNAPHLVALVRAGATFINGQLVERADEKASA